MNLRTIPRATLCWIVLPLGLILYSAWAFLLAVRNAPSERVDAVYHRFGALCIRLAGTRLVVHGLENAPPDRPYVIVTNHESNWDPVGLIAGFADRAVRFVIKREITRIPIFGHTLLRTGNVMVDRASTRQDIERIRHGMRERQIDVSILFYAEGTRSRDGALQSFKKGAFATAIAYGLPVLPVGHGGAYRIWTPSTPWIRRNPMVIEVGRPIPVAGLELADRNELMRETRDAVTELRSRARRAVRALGGDPGGVD